MPGRLQLEQSRQQRGENKGGICLHPGLHTGPTLLRPQPGGPHPKSFFIFPTQPPKESHFREHCQSPNVGAPGKDPHDKAVNLQGKVLGP